MVEYSVCKEELGDFEKLSDVFASDVLQLDYSFDPIKNKLTLRCINVSFNCCIDSLHSNISLMNDTILVQLFEESPYPCRCYCLYDLTMLITGIEAKKYTVKITQPQYPDAQESIFDIDL